MLRITDLFRDLFNMCQFLSRLSQPGLRQGGKERELTHLYRKSSLWMLAPLLPGQRAGKTACHGPAAATAGFFLSSLLPSHTSPKLGCICIDEGPLSNVSLPSALSLE